MHGARVPVLLVCAVSGAITAAGHSGTVRVSLSLRRRESRVRLCVTDDGTGFDPAAPVDGFGFTSMRERASSVRGDLRISSVPGRNTEVEAMM